MKYATPKGHTNKKMDSGVYQQRRQVIDILYKVKSVLRSNGLEMPRIDIRITTKDKDVTSCGVAQMRGKFIWIPETTLTKPYLYQTVLHELCHAIWGVNHDEKCKLMHPLVQLDLTDEQAEQIFLTYAKKLSL